MAFADKSKELRAEKKLTQAQLAQALNLSRSCISMIEIGINEPTAATLIAYAKFFEVSADELLELDDFGIRTAAPSSATAGEPLTAEERQIIEEYRKLPESSKDLFKRMAGIKTTTKK